MIVSEIEREKKCRHWVRCCFVLGFLVLKCATHVFHHFWLYWWLCITHNFIRSATNRSRNVFGGKSMNGFDSKPKMYNNKYFLVKVNSMKTQNNQFLPKINAICSNRSEFHFKDLKKKKIVIHLWKWWRLSSIAMEKENLHKYCGLIKCSLKHKNISSLHKKWEQIIRNCKGLSFSVSRIWMQRASIIGIVLHAMQRQTKRSRVYSA